MAELWLERLICDNSEMMIDSIGCPREVVHVSDLREQLGQYLLCEKEPVGYICLGDPDASTTFTWQPHKCDCGEPRSAVHALAPDLNQKD
jgi:hypothetical protein